LTTAPFENVSIFLHLIRIVVIIIALIISITKETNIDFIENPSSESISTSISCTKMFKLIIKFIVDRKNNNLLNLLSHINNYLSDVIFFHFKFKLIKLIKIFSWNNVTQLLEKKVKFNKN
jgi:hypothetical protein